MGQCLCKEKRRRDERDSLDEYNRTTDGSVAGPSNSGRGLPSNDLVGIGLAAYHHQRLANIGFDIRDLILETLNVIRTLVNNEQEPPPSMLKLNMIADKEQGWLLIVQTMIDIIPSDNPLGPAVVTLFLDESPLPTKETVSKLLFHLNLDGSSSPVTEKRSATWHRNVCIVLGCIAEKLAGPNSVATFKSQTLEYLLNNLTIDRPASVILFSLIALEKYAQTSENKVTIADRLAQMRPNPLEVLEAWIVSPDFEKRQVGFCAQWSLDNLFVKDGRPYSYETMSTKGINAMLNHEDVSEYLKIGPSGLEARCDVSSFESVRCTFEVTEGRWFYEALVVTPGVMQIGWATKHSKFLNHEGYGIGDDEFSVAYDGCRRLVWYNASSTQHSHDAWTPGDILGCLLDVEGRRVQFYLNGQPLSQPHTQVFERARCGGLFAAASFMSFQQCLFNFGHEPFVHPPPADHRRFNDYASLDTDHRLILPRHQKLKLLRQVSVPENFCQLCCNQPASTTLFPCQHTGFCTKCALMLEMCPMCRASIKERRETSAGDVPSANRGNPAKPVPVVEDLEDQLGSLNLDTVNAPRTLTALEQTDPNNTE